MILHCILSAISDVIMVISTIFLIVSLGINKMPSTKKLMSSAIINCLLATIIFFTYLLDINFSSIFIYPSMFWVAYKLSFGKINLTQIYIALVTELFVTLLSLCGTTLIFQLSILSYDLSETISLALIRLLVCIFSYVLCQKGSGKKVHTISKIIPKHVFLLVVIALACIDTLAVFNNYPDNSTLKQNIITVLIAILTITLVVMILSLLINVASKNYYTALNSLLEKQVEAQITHYEKLEELNKDIRQLRHDYINHLTSVSTLIEHKNYSDALQYIERLTESTHCNEIIFSTGNHLADAILTGKSSECKEFADIEFNGIITDRINNTDMCAILANALDNAIEACRKCSGRSKISIAAQNKQGYWVMTMRNPTIGEDTEGLMKTSKEDTQNHGFGLLSIEQAVKRYDGNIKVGIKDGIFEISIVVKD